MSEQPDQYVTDAVKQEQRLLDEALQRAQAEHLFSRVVTLSAELARRDAQPEPPSEATSS